MTLFQLLNCTLPMIVLIGSGVVCKLTSKLCSIFHCLITLSSPTCRTIIETVGFTLYVIEANLNKLYSNNYNEITYEWQWQVKELINGSL